MTTVFDELMTELEDMAKSMPEADEKLESKAEEEAETDHAEPDADNAGGPSDNDEDNEGEGMAKSMTVTLADGSKAEAIDGMALIKSMQDKLDATVEGSGKVLKALSSELIKQAELIKSLKSEIGSLKSEGRGRKTAVVSMAGAPEESMAKSMATPSDVLAKCIEAQSAGRLTALDVSVAEGYVNRGMPVPDRIAAALS